MLNRPTLIYYDQIHPQLAKGYPYAVDYHNIGQQLTPYCGKPPGLVGDYGIPQVGYNTACGGWCCKYPWSVPYVPCSYPTNLVPQLSRHAIPHRPYTSCNCSRCLK